MPKECKEHKTWALFTYTKRMEVIIFICTYSLQNYIITYNDNFYQSFFTDFAITIWSSSGVVSGKWRTTHSTWSPSESVFRTDWGTQLRLTMNISAGKLCSNRTIITDIGIIIPNGWGIVISCFWNMVPLKVNVHPWKIYAMMSVSPTK